MMRDVPPIVWVLIVVLCVALGVVVYEALTYEPPSRARDIEEDNYEDKESETW